MILQLAAVVASVLVVSFLACAPRAAEVPDALVMELSAATGSVERVTVSLEDTPGGVRVSIEGSGFRAGAYTARLIAGNCADAESVRFQLSPLFAGEAGTVKGQALAPGVRLRDLIGTHALVIGDGAGVGRVSCALLSVGN